MRDLERMRQILLKDKMWMPEYTENSIRADMCSALSQYMEIERDSVDIKLNFNADGSVEVLFFARAGRLKGRQYKKGDGIKES